MSIDKIKNYINTVRRDFADKPFSEEMADDDPLKQYAIWFQEAVDSKILTLMLLVFHHLTKWQGFF